ncbi:MAG: prolyl oligopeptidase family serine peptidase [Deltaproteobacteria bacterium]|nr:prolyl oligopeptidase family serine peptidase [Deltaproteobacteria bacterium]
MRRLAFSLVLLTGCFVRAGSPDQRLPKLHDEAADVPPDPSPGCTHPTGTPGGWLSMWSGDHQRNYLLRVPAGVARGTPMPLVLNFHGWLESARTQEKYTFMTESAGNRGMVVVYPQGIGWSWNAGNCCARAQMEEIDDVGFVRDLVDRLEHQLCIDRRRVYATGMSNGGIMSYRLACEMSDTFAAIAPVAGGEAVPDCKPKRPVSVLSFHGQLDTVVWFNGGGAAGLPSAKESVDRWARRDACGSPTKAVFDLGEVACRASERCPAGTDVVLCTVGMGGHTWPGGAIYPGLGHTTGDISATESMLDFFLAHPMREQPGEK